jgi:hypothetical protein
VVRSVWGFVTLQQQLGYLCPDLGVEVVGHSGKGFDLFWICQDHGVQGLNQLCFGYFLIYGDLHEVSVPMRTVLDVLLVNLLAGVARAVELGVLDASHGEGKL